MSIDLGTRAHPSLSLERLRLSNLVSFQHRSCMHLPRMLAARILSVASRHGPQRQSTSCEDAGVVSNAQRPGLLQ
jgi:hypothetical protein